MFLCAKQAICRSRLGNLANPLNSSQKLRLFARNEDGSFIVFTVMIFTLMLLIAGISLDIERFETVRTKLQNTADGAALAAASLTQSVPAADIVDDYFAVSNMSIFFEDLDVNEALNEKNVMVEASVNVPTHFFNMIGIDNLGTIVRSGAREAIGNVEISLVLDVSGSMRSNSKLANLKTAAKDFVDAIYQDTAPGSVSINIVPYSTQVSVGPDILSHFTNRDVAHDNSYCLNFDTADFGTTAVDLTAPVEQTLHMDARNNENSGWSAGNGLWTIECSTRGWTDVLVMSENITKLKNYIDSFQATDWTSIELGVKWGATMLDPSFRPVVAGLAAGGHSDSAFADRPLGFDDIDTLKVLVVMTDGINTNQYSMEEPFRTGMSPVFVYYDNLDRPYYSIWGGAGVPDPASSGTQWYLANDYSSDGVSPGWFPAPYGLNDATQMSWAALWAEVPVEFFADRYLRNMGGQNTLRNAIKSARTYVNASTKDPRTRAICAAAKSQGIRIYTIGFEAPYQSEVLLQDCATTSSHFFDVEGTEISQAFSAIAADINRLRLVQ